MDYDFITTCNWTATGTYTLRAYRGSDTNVVTTYYASIFYRKKGTTTWTALNSSGQMVVNSTGEWEVANDWNKNGNDCLTHSYSGITAINSCTSVEFNETSLGATVGNYFLCGCWNNCTSLTSMPAGFNLPTGITSVGGSFLSSCWRYCTKLTSMPSGFNLPTEITSVGGSFLSSCWENCTSLSSMPSGFNLPTGITSGVDGFFLFWCWCNCTLLNADGYTEDIDFEYGATSAFGGTCPIKPDSPTAGSSVAVNRSKEPTVTTQSATNVAQTSCTGNGNITATGTANVTRRGFCYLEGESGTPTISDNVSYDDGDYGTGAFTKTITGLSAGTSYRVRAYATNTVDTGYGSTVTVTTLSPSTATGINTITGISTITF